MVMGADAVACPETGDQRQGDDGQDNDDVLPQIEVPLRFRILRVAPTMSSLAMPYFFMSSSPLPDSPNVSFTATDSSGVGRFHASISATAPPRPACFW